MKSKKKKFLISGILLFVILALTGCSANIKRSSVSMTPTLSTKETPQVTPETIISTPEDVAVAYLNSSVTFDFEQMDKYDMVKYETRYKALVAKEIAGRDYTEQEVLEGYAKMFEIESIPQDWNRLQADVAIYVEDYFKERYGNNCSITFSVISSEEMPINELDKLSGKFIGARILNSLAIKVDTSEVQACKIVKCQAKKSGETTQAPLPEQTPTDATSNGNNVSMTWAIITSTFVGPSSFLMYSEEFTIEIDLCVVQIHDEWKVLTYGDI